MRLMHPRFSARSLLLFAHTGQDAMKGDTASNVSASPTKAKIFISYSRKDRDFADRLDAALKARGFEPLIDRTEIYVFEDWWQRIRAGRYGRPGWQRDLSVSYSSVGDVQVAQGNLPAALASYQASLAIMDRLAKSDAGNAYWQRDLTRRIFPARSARPWRSADET